MQNNLSIPAGAAVRGLSAHAARNAGARIPCGIRFEGTGTFASNVAVEGVVCGSLNLAPDAQLLVAPTGQLEGSFQAGHARIEGRVDGQIDCSGGTVDIAQTARCKVKVLYGELSVARGAEMEAELQRVTEVKHG